MKKRETHHTQEDNILCFEIMGTVIRAASLSVQAEKKIITLNGVCEDTFSFSEPEKIKTLYREVRAMGGERAAKIIFNVSADFGTTLHGGTGSVRQNYEENISEPELEQILARALWKIFTTQRSRAAKQLGIGDGEAVLADVDVTSITLDGSKVMNPVGFVARATEVWCEETVLSRKNLQKIVANVPAADIASIGELSGHMARMVEKTKNETDYLFVYIEETRALLYPVLDGKLGTRETVEWGSNAFINIIMRSLSVDREVAREIVGRYEKGKLSKSLQKEIETLFIGEASLLLHGIELKCQREKFKTVYLYAPEKFPVEITNANFKRRLQLSFSLHNISAQTISEKYGFTLQLNEQQLQSNKKYDTIFLSVVGAYTRYAGGSIEKIAKQRIRWLQA